MTYSKTDTGKERRKLERKQLLFYLRVLEGSENDVLGHLVNFSSGGLMLLSDVAVAVHKKYKLRLRLPAFTCERSEVVFDAFSRWCHQDVNPEFYLTGYQVEEFDESHGNEGYTPFDQLQRLENFTRIYRSTWNNSLA
jgi:hypothetical protein